MIVEPDKAERLSRLVPAVVVGWAVLLSAILGLPFLTGSDSAGDNLIRNTIWLALVYYAAAAWLMLYLERGDWSCPTAPGRLARSLWTLGSLAFLVHVGMAFHYAHGWSHAAAVRHTEEVSGVGEGIYVSYLFTLAWTLDALWWWLWPARYAARSPWLDRLLHGFMAFVIFNGTVVFEEGATRWAGVAMFAALAAAWAFRRSRPK